MLDQQLIPSITRCSSGCVGLDDVLAGGFPAGHFYLIEGEPGNGKTTLALQFMAEGLKKGEKVLYVTLSESSKELMYVASVHGIPLDGIDILEVRPTEQDLAPEGQYTVFYPAQMELNDRMQTIMAEVDRRKPSRLIIDALSEVRMLAKDPLLYRRQILSLKEYAPENCTVLLLDDRSSPYADLELHSIVHGVVTMSRVSREYGSTMRRLEVTKLRGCAFREGFHDYVIRSGGVVVFPRLVAAEYEDNDQDASVAASGIAELDALAGGGLAHGTSTLLMGPAGCGKTTIALRWLTTAAERGENSAAFIFEETLNTLKGRAAALGMNLPPLIESGRMKIEHLDPAEVSPGEFVDTVRECVERDKVRVVLIDSLNGFLHAMPATRWYVEGFGQRSGISTQLHLPEHTCRLPPPRRLPCFRILQEALTNVHRHSSSRTVEVRIDGDDSRVVLTVRDRGTGVPREILDRFWKTGNVGVGLAGIRERLKELGGILEIESNLDGTILRATIPLASPENIDSPATDASAASEKRSNTVPKGTPKLKWA